jgi:hypothetical protein
MMHLLLAQGVGHLTLPPKSGDVVGDGDGLGPAACWLEVARRESS